MSTSGAFGSDLALHRRELVEQPAQAHALAQRLAARTLDGHAVGHRVGERHADLDHVGLVADLREVLAEFLALRISRR